MNKDMEYEVERLSVVRGILDIQIQAVTIKERQDFDGVRESRKQMWEETHLIRDFDDVAALTLGQQDVTINEKRYLDSHRMLINLTKMYASPYFGRIDFTEEDYDDTEMIYIGMQSLYDDSGTFYVYDWRAPISSMFYDYGVGKAAFASPSGDWPADRSQLSEVRGDISLKRQYKIVDGKLIYMFDSDLKIDDDILQIELSKPSSPRIKSIIASIQREQNHAIRYNGNENIMVFGPAGSGKTSVGLHRLAFLLYKHRGHITSEDIRVFSSNNIFNSYISNIIPELGEAAVAMFDFKDLIQTHMGRHYKFYDMYEQIEFLSNIEEDKLRYETLKIKTSGSFIDYICASVKAFTPKLKDIYFYDIKICDKNELLDHYMDRTSQSTLLSKAERILIILGQKLDEFYEQNKEMIRVVFEEKYDEILDQDGGTQRFRQYRDILLAETRKHLLPDKVSLYKMIFRKYCRVNRLETALADHACRAIHSPVLYFEDMLVLFFIRTVTGEIGREKKVKQILIDEAQDMSILQHRIILNIYGNCNFTILSDINQSLYTPININDKCTLADLYRENTAKSLNVITLQRSYRSTYEISCFAANILNRGLTGRSPAEAFAHLLHFPAADTTMYYERHGDEPQIIKTDNTVQAIFSVLESLSEKDCLSVGILLKTTSRARKLYGQLCAAKPDLDIVITADADDEFKTGIVVMPVAYAKGLEFDAVIIPYSDQYFFYSEDDRKVLYLMCTRALHHLYLLC